MVSPIPDYVVIAGSFLSFMLVNIYAYPSVSIVMELCTYALLGRCHARVLSLMKHDVDRVATCEVLHITRPKRLST